MPRKWRFRITEILDAIEKIETYTKGMDRAAFEEDPRTFDAVLMNFAVIGEAAAGLPDVVTRKYPDNPWPRMRGLRNLIVHDYAAIKKQTIWETVTINLPALKPALRRVLENEPEE